MDILHLVDRLEELFNESRPIPLTHSVIVDEDRILEIIDQMRISIPDEVKKAQQVIAQRDRVLAQAQEEANRTIGMAKQKVDELMGRDAIVQAAQTRSEQILAQARVDAEVGPQRGRRVHHRVPGDAGGRAQPAAHPGAQRDLQAQCRSATDPSRAGRDGHVQDTLTRSLRGTQRPRRCRGLFAPGATPLPARIRRWRRRAARTSSIPRRARPRPPRMRGTADAAVRPREELGMELAADHERMIGDFGDLHQPAVR